MANHGFERTGRFDEEFNQGWVKSSLHPSLDLADFEALIRSIDISYGLLNS